MQNLWEQLPAARTESCEASRQRSLSLPDFTRSPVLLAEWLHNEWNCDSKSSIVGFLNLNVCEWVSKHTQIRNALKTLSNLQFCSEDHFCVCLKPAQISKHLAKVKKLAPGKHVVSHHLLSHQMYFSRLWRCYLGSVNTWYFCWGKIPCNSFIKSKPWNKNGSQHVVFAWQQAWNAKCDPALERLVHVDWTLVESQQVGLIPSNPFFDCDG